MTHDFQYVKNMVDALRATSSTKDKEDIIKSTCGIFNNPSANFAKKVLLYTYHPLWQYNVTSDNLKKKNHLVARENKYENFFDLLDDLKNRKITGHDAIAAVNSFVEHNDEYEELIHCIIDKDLKTRAGDKIINKAIPNHIPEFSVALADKYEPKLVKWEDEWYVSRKLDGVRCIGIVDSDGNTSFYSRSGKSFDTLSVVADGISALGVKDVVFDGELCLVDDDGNEDFQGIMKQLKKKNHTIPNPSFKIFDCLSTTEFNTKTSTHTLSQRFEKLTTIMKDNECPCLSILDQELIKDDVHFQSWVKKAADNNWEGVMLRKNNSYKGKRSKDILKCKVFHDDEYEIIGIEYGPFRYVKNGQEHEEIMMSNAHIVHKGYRVNVGSGFTIEERQDYYKNPHKIVGKIATIQYFEETHNQEGGISLRFPTFKFLHGDERNT